MDWFIRALDEEVSVSDFDSGEEALDEYLRRYAKQDIKRNLTRIFVASPTTEPLITAGFYSLSASSIAADTLPEKWRKKLPRYPVPAALIGRLAVRRNFQGQGLGGLLLVDACKRVAAASQTLAVAVAAIIVDAKSPQATAFYQHFGFIELPGQPGRWMLPASHINNPEFSISGCFNIKNQLNNWKYLKKYFVKRNHPVRLRRPPLQRRGMGVASLGDVVAHDNTYYINRLHDSNNSTAFSRTIPLPWRGARRAGWFQYQVF